MRVPVLMGDPEAVVVAALNGEAPSVHGAMMPGAENNEFSGLVSAAIGPGEKVMDVQPQQAGAAWNFAAPTRAMQQLLP